jgi:CheY-like chemotaxis protein
MKMSGCPSTCREGSFGAKAIISGINCTQKATNSLTALIVDDNPIVLECTAAMLKKIGYGIHMASEGAEALFHLKHSPCNLLLTDYEMPVINGYQLSQKTKSLFTGTRVVIMTGQCQAAVTEKMGDRFIDAWLFKPFRMEQLKDVLASIGLPVGSVHRARSFA